MKLIIQQMKGEKFELELEPPDSVGTVKAKITEKLGVPSTSQKLIFKGKILNDSTSLADSSIIEGDSLILVVNQSEQAPPTEPPVAAAEEPLTPHERLLCEMGYPLLQVRSTLSECNGDYGAALVLLLTRGLPGPQPSRSQDLSGLMENSEFRQVVEMIRSHPEAFDQFLVELEHLNPELFSLVSRNQEEFLRLVGAPERSQRVQLSRAEEEDVRELMSFGFSAQDAIEAYLICEKDKARAASYLFENTNN